MKDGDLEKYLTENKNLDRKLILDWFSQIISAIDYLHNHETPCIHRDIKPK